MFLFIFIQRVPFYSISNYLRPSYLLPKLVFLQMADAIRELTKTAREQADTIYERAFTQFENYCFRAF